MKNTAVSSFPTPLGAPNPHATPGPGDHLAASSLPAAPPDPWPSLLKGVVWWLRYLAAAFLLPSQASLQPGVGRHLPHGALGNTGPQQRQSLARPRGEVGGGARPLEPGLGRHPEEGDALRPPARSEAEGVLRAPGSGQQRACLQHRDEEGPPLPAPPLPAEARWADPAGPVSRLQSSAQPSSEQEDASQQISLPICLHFQIRFHASNFISV